MKRRRLTEDRAGRTRVLLLGSFFIGLGWACPARALDPSKAITQYHQDTWTERDGLPQGSVQAVTQTPDGYLWIATRAGLARFDGVRFTVFDTGTTPALRSNDIRSLYADHRGRLWIGTFNGGLCFLEKGRFSRVTAQPGFSGMGVLDMIEVSPDEMMLATWHGAFRLKPGEPFSLRPWKTAGEAAMMSLCVDADHSIWAGTRSGLFRIRQAKAGAFDARHALLHDVINKVFLDSRGRLWIGSLGGLSRFRGGEFVHLTVREGLADNRVRNIYEDSDGNLWIATWGGVSRIKDGVIRNYTKKDGLPHNFVETIFEDREGSLWLGTRGAGLVRLRDSKFTIFTTKEGLASDFTKCVLETRNGSIWVGTDGEGVTRLQGGTRRTYTEADGLASGFVWSLCEDSNGDVWAGTARPPGLHVFREGHFLHWGPEEGFRIKQRVRTITADRQGQIWVGGNDGGLCRFRSGRFRYFTEADGLPSGLIRVILQDHRDRLWVGTDRGLCRMEGDRFKIFDRQSGLVHQPVYCIHEDRDGVLWFGTQRGLAVYHRGRFRSYAEKDGLAQNSIYSILEDDDGFLWMSCNRGIFRVAKAAFDRFERHEIARLSCEVYGISDGLETLQCEGGSQPSGWRGRDGRFWFPTVRGLASISPGELEKNAYVPPVHIEDVIYGDRHLDLRQPLELKPGSRELRFEFTGLSFLAPDRVRFRTKLDGFSEVWSEASPRRMAVYNNLAPGHYNFRVVASNNDGVWNRTGASAAFYIAPYFYQTMWFYGLAAFLVAAMAWRFHGFRMKKARQEFSLVLAERSRIARDLHDTLAQGFAGIAFQLEAVSNHLKDSPVEARKHLVLGLKMVRHSQADVRRSIMNLRSNSFEGSTLSSVIKDWAVEWIADQPIALEVDAAGLPGELDGGTESDLLHITQEAITNAVKHGRPATIRVRLAADKEWVRLDIVDDGVGYDESDLLQTGLPHFGLAGIRERASHSGGVATLTSRVNQGTHVAVRLPRARKG